MKKCSGEFVEQIIRPTGLLDPGVEIRSAEGQVEDMLGEIKKEVAKGNRVLITTLTKKLAEELTKYYHGVGIKVRYLHSDVTTIERMEILRDLRLGEFDCLIGINLLREGLDLPEVSLVGIMDADKEGFLRSYRSLIQTIGRAARNSEGRVNLYAYKTTKSMKEAISETNRRRKIQDEYNQKMNITPVGIKKKISGGVIETLRGSKNSKKTKRVVDYNLSGESVDKLIKDLKVQMGIAAKNLDFEKAAKIRDEIKELSEARLLF